MENKINYQKIFSDNNCLKPMKPVVDQIYLLKNKLEKIIEKKETIPEEIIKKHQKLYQKFTGQFFTKKTIECLTRKNREIIYEGMLRTKKTVKKYLRIINSPLFMFLGKNTVESYKKFLELSNQLCDDFIKKIALT